MTNSINVNADVNVNSPYYTVNGVPLISRGHIKVGFPPRYIRVEEWERPPREKGWFR